MLGDCIIIEVKTTGVPAGGVVGSGAAVVAGGASEDGASGMELGDGTIVVGGIDVVWMTVGGPSDEELSVKEGEFEGARVLEGVTE